MAMYTDGSIKTPTLLCAGFEGEPKLSFEGTFGDAVYVKMDGCGVATISREEIAALAALFPFQREVRFR